jgi:pyrroloquinoline-quinone synthase
MKMSPMNIATNRPTKECIMEIETPVLEHPFYQAWEAGEVTREQLAAYAEAYQEFMDRVPEMWERVLDGLGVENAAAEDVVEEERAHADLWSEWAVELPEAEDAPRLNELFDGLAEMNASELAGAIHAYEVQQPEVAETKKKGLLEHYGFDEDQTAFFDEHMDEDDHIAFGEMIAEEYADSQDFARGFEQGAELVYGTLDNFAQ